MPNLKQSLIKAINQARVHAGALPWNILTFLIDSFLLLFYRKKINVKTNRILIVRLDAIGDFILWLDAAKALKDIYPKDKYELILLGNQLWTELADDTNFFNEVWSLNTKKYNRSISYHWKIGRKIREAGFSSTIQPTYSRLFGLGDSVIRISGAKEKIGFDGDHSVEMKFWKLFSNNWYTRLIPANSKPLMELDRNAEFVRELGLKDFRPSLPQLYAKGDLPKEIKDKNYYVIFPVAGVGRRQWDVLNFVEIIKRINKSTGWTAVLCGSKGERILGEMIQNNFDSEVIDLIGKTNLKETANIISKARFVISNETSAIHIATSVGMKSICILGGGHYGRFIPYPAHITHGQLSSFVNHPMECYGCNWKCIYQVSKNKAVPCISNISLESVWQKVSILLN